MSKLTTLLNPDGQKMTCAAGSQQYIFIGFQDNVVNVYQLDNEENF